MSRDGDFEVEITVTVWMLGLISLGRVDVSGLSDDFEGRERCHYRHRASQGMNVAIRIMFSRADEGV